jgi:hypothetical protein
VPALHQIPNTLDVLLARLHESHEVPVYEAIERLVQAAESVGIDADGLIRMLGRGVPLEAILELIAVRMGSSQTEAESGPNGERAA